MEIFGYQEKLKEENLYLQGKRDRTCRKNPNYKKKFLLLWTFLKISYIVCGDKEEPHISEINSSTISLVYIN